MQLKKCKECCVEKRRQSFSKTIWNQPDSWSKLCSVCHNKLYIKNKPIKIKNVKGIIYIISNKAWKGWYKVGKSEAKEIEKRIYAYNICSPFKDYELLFSINADNVRVIEQYIHKALRDENCDNKGEWYFYDLEKIKKAIIDALKYQPSDAIQIANPIENLRIKR